MLALITAVTTHEAGFIINNLKNQQVYNSIYCVAYFTSAGASITDKRLVALKPGEYILHFIRC